MNLEVKSDYVCNSVPSSSCRNVCEHFNNCIDDYIYELHNKISNLYIGLSNYEHFIESLYNDIGDYLNDSKRSDENS